jgi:CTP synthase
MSKYIFVTGGVFSSVGKGVVAGSLGRMLQERGIKVGIQKLDPYINVDPGTLSPYQHGEVFVTNDGAETDLDLGHYERFLDINIKRSCSVSSGQIYERVISKERKGEYLGRTIQVVPHITQEIKCSIEHAALEMDCDVLVVEVGGTVGDLEGAPFIEAIRQMRFDYGDKSTMFVHLTWLPFLQSTNELKTKPSQHSLRDLRSLGIIPDIIIARADEEIDDGLCTKIAHFASVPEKHIFPLVTEKNPYKVPLQLEKKGVGQFLVDRLDLKDSVKEPDWSKWRKTIQLSEKVFDKKITIALVGKYVELQDSYLSVKEALLHASRHKEAQLIIKWVHAEKVTEEDASGIFKDCDGILVPGGFGDRGVEGKIIAARFARKNKIPYLGLCLGMQVMCIELARTFVNATANSAECEDKTEAPVVALMDEQHNVTDKGGTMRLGIYPCRLLPGSKAAFAYGNKDVIHERHRHRFEFNNKYREKLEAAGLIISGQSPDGNLVEIVEFKDHPFMVASQFHPEFLSRPDKPHPLFEAFIQAAV